MYERDSYFTEGNISEPWFDEIDKTDQYHREMYSNAFPKRIRNTEKSGTISLNSSKYYSLPCNCGLVENISAYQKLRTQIYFDTRTKNFYKSDINSTLMLPNGQPYMDCPRHSQYFSDVIRLHTNPTVNKEGENRHHKIMLFDTNSQRNNYTISNSSYFVNRDNDDDLLQDHMSDLESASNKYKTYSPSYSTKHFSTCSTHHNENSSCNCDEQVSTARQNYIRENSVVADVLGDHGIDVVIPPQDFYMLNNPLFTNQNNGGTRLAKARWVRRNDRLENSFKNNDNSLYCRDKSLNQHKKSFIDTFTHDTINQSPFYDDSRTRTYGPSDYTSNRIYDRSNKSKISFNETMDDDQYAGVNKSKNLSKNATFTVFTRPKRHHSENEDFYADNKDDLNSSHGKSFSNIDRMNGISVVHSNRSDIPEDDLQRWVTVIGFQPRFIGQVIRYMNSFGPILKIKTSKTCNYLHLMYSRVDSANDAIQKATINIDNSMIVSIKPCTNTFIPNEHIQCFDPESKNINSFNNNLNISNYFSWITTAISKIVEYVDGFINEP